MADPDTIAASVSAQLPGRSAEALHLARLFGAPEEYTPPALFVYGNTATGKTAVLRALMSAMKAPYAYVNCAEAYAPRLAFEHILNQVCDCHYYPLFLHG